MLKNITEKFRALSEKLRVLKRKAEIRPGSEKSADRSKNMTDQEKTFSDRAKTWSHRAKALLKKPDPKKCSDLLKNKKFIVCSAALIILICAAIAACSTDTGEGENTAVVVEDEPVETPKNPMDGASVADDYRYANYLGAWNGVSVFSNGSENFGMELLSIRDQSGAYASAVAGIALSVPDVNVYDVLVPTAQEFYAPNSSRTNQTAGITDVYQDLLSRNIPNLTPVNIVSALSEHAAEKIYFCTDHHWTQRGAYYAYAEYSRKNPDIAELDPLETYRTENNYGYKGSLCSFTNGTDGSALLSQNPDMLQFFYPKPEYEAAVYSDPYMTSYMQNVEAICPRLMNYSSFLQGDFPLEVYKTNVNNGRKLCIIKESYGDAFSVWALNNYEEIYIVDYRMWNGGTYGGYDSSNIAFKIKDFHDFAKFDDLIIISYPVSVSVDAQTSLLAAMSA